MQRSIKKVVCIMNEGNNLSVQTENIFINVIPLGCDAM
jgi:hypothetical protein